METYIIRSDFVLVCNTHFLKFQSIINKYKDVSSYIKMCHYRRNRFWMPFHVDFKNIWDYDSLGKGKELQLSLFFWQQCHRNSLNSFPVSISQWAETHPAAGVTLFSAEKFVSWALHLLPLQHTLQISSTLFYLQDLSASGCSGASSDMNCARWCQRNTTVLPNGVLGRGCEVTSSH